MEKSDKIKYAAELVDSKEDIQKYIKFLEDYKLDRLSFYKKGEATPISISVLDIMELDINGNLEKGLQIMTEVYQEYIIGYLNDLEQQRTDEINKIL